MFGLGTVFYELLTSTRLFKRETEMATLKAVVGAKVLPPSEVVPGIPKALDAVVLKALARNRDERFATAGEHAARLEDFLFKQQLPAPPAHLAAFMQELYAEELEEELSSEPTIIQYDPRLPSRKPRPRPDSTAPTALLPCTRRRCRRHETRRRRAAPKAPGRQPAFRRPPRSSRRPRPTSDTRPEGRRARKTSRSGKGEK